MSWAFLAGAGHAREATESLLMLDKIWGGCLRCRTGGTGKNTPDSAYLYKMSDMSFREFHSVLKKSLSARSAIHKSSKSRPKHYENGVFSP
jgi:hypothetical protein